MSMPELIPVADVNKELEAGGQWDAVVAVAPGLRFPDAPTLQAAADAYRRIDAGADEGVHLLSAPALAGGRLILSGTGPVDRDYDDVRRFGDAAASGVKKARDAGAKNPLLILGEIPTGPEFQRALEVSLLAAAGCLWHPLEAKESHSEEELEPVRSIGFSVPDSVDGAALAMGVKAMEDGRRIARDICGTEPERMSPPKLVDYCLDCFSNGPVAVEVLEDPTILEQEYPLLMAVARASMPVERHQPRVIRLEYVGEGEIDQTLLLAGKGVVYDTGGADLKVGGHMAGMSRDKGGAAAVIGFVRAVAEIQPPGVRVVAEIGAVRNSIGADAFVSDEIITSHAGVRVRIGNTDAEGRLVLADLLSHLREEALVSPHPTISSCATLTGHAALCAGPYSIAIENGPAQAMSIAHKLAARGDHWGDPFEISRMRREDFEFIKAKSKADDILSCNNAPSSATKRGHQFPAAFLVRASGLDKHGRNSEKPIPFTHIDVAGSAIAGSDWQHGMPTGAPIVAMSAAFLG